MKASSKTQWLLLGSCILGTLLALQYMRQSKNPRLHFVENTPENKNFGLFPPDIPEKQFEDSLFL